MKLVMACIAALSLFGCAEDPTSNGGENLAGVRPAKPSIDDPTNTNQPATPAIFEGMNGRGMRVPSFNEIIQVQGAFAETIKPQEPVKGVCDNCEVIAVHVPSHHSVDTSISEDVTMFSSDGTYLCSLQLDKSGGVATTDCGWYR